MRPETSVINVFGKHNIYCEHHQKEEHAKTVILVNGAFATTTSFSQTVRYLRDKANVILFDLPYAGRSKDHNPDGAILTKEDEVEILGELIDRYSPNYLMSVSWGGVSSLLSLARRPPTIEKAIIASFSPVINEPMRDYMSGARDFLMKGDQAGAAQLLNNTVGRYLSGILKSHNFDYLMSVTSNPEQIIFHINQIFEFDKIQYAQQFAAINVPVLFLNGELDNYTTCDDVQLLAPHMPQSKFTSVANAGHFLDLESRQLWRTVSGIIREYLFDEVAAPVVRQPLFVAPAPRFQPTFGHDLLYAEAAD